MKLYILDGDSENTGVYNYIKNADYKFETSEFATVQQLFKKIYIMYASW